MAKRRNAGPSDYTQEEAPTPLERSAGAREEASRPPGAVPAVEAPPAAKPRPVHEIRLSRVKAVIWANQTEAGLRHNVTVVRLFKPEGGQWQESHAFGRDELPVAAEVLRRAWLWVLEQGSHQQ